MEKTARIEWLIDNETGVIDQNILERGDENCAGAVIQAQRLGTVLSDEQTGPDCDTVHEGVAGD